MSKEPRSNISNTRQLSLTENVGKTTIPMILPSSTLQTDQNQNLDPMNLPSLPEWLTSRLGMVSRQGWGQPGIIPASQELSVSQRGRVRLMMRDLDTLCQKTSLTDPHSANEVLGAITRLLLALPSKASGEATGEAKAEAYMIALEDMPAWAVTGAIRGWYRGEHGTEHNYTFAPAPAVLRRLAMAERWKVEGRIKALGELLEAVPEIEHNEEHRTEMLGKLRGIGVGG